MWTGALWVRLQGSIYLSAKKGQVQHLPLSSWYPLHLFPSQKVHFSLKFQQLFGDQEGRSRRTKAPARSGRWTRRTERTSGLDSVMLNYPPLDFLFHEKSKIIINTKRESYPFWEIGLLLGLFFLLQIWDMWGKRKRGELILTLFKGPSAPRWSAFRTLPCRVFCAFFRALVVGNGRSREKYLYCIFLKLPIS